MTKVVVKKKLNALLSPFFKEDGFKYLSNRETYVADRSDVLFDIQFRILPYSGLIRIDPGVGIIHKRISEIFHRTSQISEIDQLSWSTLGWGAGRFSGKYNYAHFDIQTENDIEKSSMWCKDIYLEVAKPLFDKFATIESVHELLNSDPNKASPCSAGEWVRSSVGLIAAHLLKSENESDLRRIYARKLESNNNGFDLPKFQALLKDLK